jgi:hypothetical protein
MVGLEVVEELVIVAVLAMGRITSQILRYKILYLKIGYKDKINMNIY